ncbi:MAG: DNA-formamidopyrimidine glycosylase, partial [Dehalococcoidia bacterium]|nr:DNA-formamidopyrimidine glycosylase [Dehalococcoidia bacterium]
MPELPEVETIKNEIAPIVVNRCVKKVTVFDTKPFKNISPADFAAGVVGRTIIGLSRRGKYLIFELSSPAGCPAECHKHDVSLLIHLKMSGALLVDPPDNHKHCKVLFQLDNGTRFAFVDPRQFGSIWLVKDPHQVLEKLGPEPFDANFTVDLFSQKLNCRNAPIKALLLDQTLIAGIGNMYADEALFTARIHPERRAVDLTADDVRRLYHAI